MTPHQADRIQSAAAAVIKAWQGAWSRGGTYESEAWPAVRDLRTALEAAGVRWWLTDAPPVLSPTQIEMDLELGIIPPCSHDDGPPEGPEPGFLNTAHMKLAEQAGFLDADARLNEGGEI